MITFFSFNHTMWYITLIDFLLKCLCIPGTTNCNYFLFWVPFLAPCLRSCFGGSMSFPVLGTHQKLQFFSWNVLLEGSGSLDLLISDVGVAKRLQGRAQCFRLCICHREARWKSGAEQEAAFQSYLLWSLNSRIQILCPYLQSLFCLINIFLVKSITFLISCSEHFL